MLIFNIEMVAVGCNPLRNLTTADADCVEVCLGRGLFVEIWVTIGV